MEDYETLGKEHLNDFIGQLKIIFNKIKIFNKYHNDMWPTHVKTIEEGISNTNNGIILKGHAYVAELFIRHTYSEWHLNGNVDRDTTLKSFLLSITQITNSELSKWDSMYVETDEIILEDLWETVKEIVPTCINYTYCMRSPYLDEETGKMRFKNAFPHGQHKLSVGKMRQVWSL